MKVSRTKDSAAGFHIGCNTFHLQAGGSHRTDRCQTILAGEGRVAGGRPSSRQLDLMEPAVLESERKRDGALVSIYHFVLEAQIDSCPRVIWPERFVL